MFRGGWSLLGLAQALLLCGVTVAEFVGLCRVLRLDSPAFGLNRTTRRHRPVFRVLALLEHPTFPVLIPTQLVTLLLVLCVPGAVTRARQYRARL